MYDEIEYTKCTKKVNIIIINYMKRMKNISFYIDIQNIIVYNIK